MFRNIVFSKIPRIFLIKENFEFMLSWDFIISNLVISTQAIKSCLYWLYWSENQLFTKLIWSSFLIFRAIFFLYLLFFTSESFLKYLEISRMNLFISSMKILETLSQDHKITLNNIESKLNRKIFIEEINKFILDISRYFKKLSEVKNNKYKKNIARNIRKELQINLVKSWFSDQYSQYKHDLIAWVEMTKLEIIKSHDSINSKFSFIKKIRGIFEKTIFRNIIFGNNNSAKRNFKRLSSNWDIVWFYLTNYKKIDDLMLKKEAIVKLIQGDFKCSTQNLNCLTKRTEEFQNFYEFISSKDSFLKKVADNDLTMKKMRLEKIHNSVQETSKKEFLRCTKGIYSCTNGKPHRRVS